MIKMASIFMLSNQLLVQVVEKILAYYDFDLILTEHYKERLDFQLKNREIYTNKDNLTEFTILNIPNLFISSAQISNSKPLSSRPHFLLFIPPLFFLFSPSQLSQSIPSIFYYNSIICFLLQLYVILSSHLIFFLSSSFPFFISI